jgi:ferredoxin--NADP+ reductase
MPDSLHVAIVGAGPAGFYAAGMLLADGHAVDLYDLLPTPFGLIRSGVAPDHPKIKGVTRVFDKAAAHPRFRFFGGVEVGVTITREQLGERYPAVIYATGMSADRKLGIPGEELPGVHPAADFVGWYNGHPHHRDDAYDLSGRHAVVVGNGNVALDIARMLVLEPDELQPTDAAEHAVDALRRSSIEVVRVLGRRGPAQAAFTNPELRELGELAGADVIVDPGDARPDRLSQAWLDTEADGTARRNVEILQTFAAALPPGKPRRVILGFLRSPVAFLGERRLEAVRLSINAIIAGPGGSLGAVATGRQEEVPADIAFRAIGYRAEPITGLPYDVDRGRLPNVEGRLTDERGARQPGEYVAGWIKRGPSGVIGTNKKCAAATVAALLEDAAAGRLQPDVAKVPEATWCDWAVDWRGWGRIDAHELEHGQARGRVRHKIVSIEEMRSLALNSGR